nr:MAG TPA: bacteriocin [Caudoviricetes sp.]
MKKKINKKKVPAYAFGIDQGLELASVLGAGMQGFSEEGSGFDIAGSALGGAAKGASIGMAAGPIGAVIGGAAGGIGNLVSGLFRKGAIAKQKRIKDNAKEIAMGKGNAATYEQEYWGENPLAYTFENGGVLSDLAYLDNNEIIRDDSGNIVQVPNNKPGTDNHLVDASNLDSVLSNKIKRPGTNKTFAQEGKKLAKMTKKSKGNDIFAKNSDMLNKRNANAMYEQLLTEQEAVKAKKGIKPKVKGIPTYADGKRSKLAQWLVDEFNSNQTGTARSDAKKQAAKNVLNSDWIDKLGEAISDFFTSPVKGTAVNSTLATAFNRTKNRAGLGATENSNWDAPVGEYLDNLNWAEGIVPEAGPAPGRTYTYRNLEANGVDAITGETIPVNTNVSAYNSPETPVPELIPTANNNVAIAVTPKTKKTISKNIVTPETITKTPVPELLQAPSLGIAAKTPVAEKIGLSLPSVNKNQNKPNVISTDLGSLSGLSPILYNWIQGRRKPEVEDPVINPYTGAINRAMASRRVNIEPTLAANRRSRAIARNNMARLNPNTGMNIAYGNQLATGEYAQNASTYANRDNMNNQYLGEYANTMNNLGQQYIQNTVLTNDLNARNRAAARNFGATAASQLGQWSQTKEKMRNQARRDRQILPYLQNFLRYGTVNSLVDSLTV